MKYRHGDIGIEPVKAQPTKGRKRLDHVTVGEGEVTGHSHRLVCATSEFRESSRTHPVTGEAYTVQYPVQGREVKAKAFLYERDGEMFISVKKKAALVHEDHGAIFLNRGTYRKIQQREWSPEGVRRVID